MTAQLCVTRRKGVTVALTHPKERENRLIRHILIYIGSLVHGISRPKSAPPSAALVRPAAAAAAAPH